MPTDSSIFSMGLQCTCTFTAIDNVYAYDDYIMSMSACFKTETGQVETKKTSDGAARHWKH